MGVAGEFPDDFFVRGDFEGLRLPAHVGGGEVIADEGVAVGESNAACGEAERIAPACAAQPLAVFQQSARPIARAIPARGPHVPGSTVAEVLFGPPR